jgi:hypothetical protein
MKRIQGYNVYLNDRFIGFCEGRSKSARKDFLAGQVIGTHMGQWLVLPDGQIEYATTVGKYFRFQPDLKEPHRETKYLDPRDPRGCQCSSCWDYRRDSR